MKRILWSAAIAAGTLACAAASSSAQVHISPSIGAYIPASDLREIHSASEEIRYSREAALGLGVNIERGSLRLSFAYAPGSKLNHEGVTDEHEAGEQTVLAAAADIVLRPLPRLLVQPYALGGVGLKRHHVELDDADSDALHEDSNELSLHFGVGADFMIKGIGIMAEITDYLSKHEDGKWSEHDAFLLVGLRLKIGSR